MYLNILHGESINTIEGLSFLQIYTYLSIGSVLSLSKTVV